MPYVVSHSVSVAVEAAGDFLLVAYKAGTVVPDSIGESILMEHPNGCVRVSHDDDLCGSMDGNCDDKSHSWAKPTTAKASAFLSPQA